MAFLGSANNKTLRSLIVALTAIVAASCSSGSAAPDGEGVDAPKTPAAVFQAQGELYGALFEDSPDFDSAVVLMSAECQDKSSDAEEVVGVVLAEVELAQSADISEESVLSIFSEISYTIEDDVALGDDGSEWVYENGGWRSTDC